eukprot:m.368026 g.368026  ORF g.368026 m.368026 type:complete len:56 (-) comp43359_c0_seq1:15-182(-)
MATVKGQYITDNTNATQSRSRIRSGAHTLRTKSMHKAHKHRVPASSYSQGDHTSR